MDLEAIKGVEYGKVTGCPSLSVLRNETSSAKIKNVLGKLGQVGHLYAGLE